MKATSYEPGKMVVKDEHFDTSSTLTNVKVLPNRRKNLPMLISRYFEHFDSKKGRSSVKVLPNSPCTLTVGQSTLTDDLIKMTKHHSGFVKVLLPVEEFYWRRLSMSKRKIKAVWLTVERVAELMRCSTRTVWRRVNSKRIISYKHQVTYRSSKVMKTFLLTDPEIYNLEMADCASRGLIPDEFFEVGIEVDGKKLNSALISQYRVATAEDGDYNASL
ncbi:MAG: helix-turn-helix domain-containing protein [Candidatus Syntrophosphaera sp.]|nr:helix-turn-helix domain-containing protein [Candidatus Syntrophosphaera sp.]